MADIGEIILKLMVDNTDLKAKLDQAQDRIGSFEKTSTAKFGNIGNMFLKMFGAGLLVRQLGMMVAQMDEVNAALAKMKAQVQGMFEETIRPGLPYIITGIETIGKVIRGIFGAFTVYGSALGAFYGLIFTGLGRIGELIRALVHRDFKSVGSIVKEIKYDIDGAVSTVAASVNKAMADYSKSSKAAAKSVKKDIMDSLGIHRQYVNSIDEESKALYRSMKAAKVVQFAVDDLGASVKYTSDQLRRMAYDAAKPIYDIADRAAGHIENLSYTIAAGLNGQRASFKEWAQSVVMDIEAVIIKMIIMKSILSLLGMIPGMGAFANILGNAWGQTPWGGASASPTIQVYSNDPATVVRVVNNAYNKAVPGEQARLANVVGRGMVINRNR